jgi:hypothetical protein
VLLLIIIFVIDFIGRQKTLCQGDTHLVQCTQKNKVIRMTGGFYGRSNTRTCKGDDNTTMCGKKNNALSLVRKKCNNKKQCIVRASNRIYKDLCKGRSAYLRVNYKCVNGKKKILVSSNSGKFKTTSYTS